MKWLLAVLFLVGCTSVPPVSRDPVSVGVMEVSRLRERLHLDRLPRDYGLEEKSFNSCSLGYRDGSKCGTRTYVAVKFRLVCRDTEDTTSEIPSRLRPLVSDRVQWKLGGQIGYVSTGSDGMGLVEMVAAASVAGSRLVLVAGKQFLGIDVSSVGDEIVVPVYWCTRS